MKITLLENYVYNDPDVKKAMNQAVFLCKGIGLNIELTYKTTSLNLTSTPLNTDVVHNGFGINYQPILDSVDGSEDIALIIYDWTKVTPNQPTNPVSYGVKKGNATVMTIPEQWDGFPTTYPDVLTQFFLHELCHCVYFLTGTPNDQTHFQFTYPSYSQKPPTDYYLFLLTNLLPSWNKYKNPQLVPIVTITRSKDDTKETMGQLTTSDGLFGCATLERPDLGNKPNISCIPKGTYTCEWHWKANSLAFHYQVMNVPGRTGIFIHAGNYFYDSVGCILLGSQPQDINKDGELDILNSRAILSAFELKMGKKPFTLVIK